MEFGSHKSGSPEIHVMLATYVYSESPEVVGLTGNITLLSTCLYLFFVSKNLCSVCIHFILEVNDRSNVTSVPLGIE